MKVTKATAEIISAESALGKLCADAEVKGVRGLFLDASITDATDLKSAITIHTEAAYALLRHGREAGYAFAPGVQARLGSQYMDLPNDPWGRPYQFFFPPWPEGGIGEVKTNPFVRPLPHGVSATTTQDAPLVYIISMGPDGKLDALSIALGQTAQAASPDDIANVSFERAVVNDTRK